VREGEMEVEREEGMEKGRKGEMERGIGERTSLARTAF